MMNSQAFCLLALAAVGMCVHSPDASACLQSGAPTFIGPARGARDVPINTRIWGVQIWEEPEPVEALLLTTVDGARVPFDVGYLKTSGSPVVVLTPRELLLPNTSYVLRDPTLGPAVLLAFTTSGDEDNTPPDVPSEIRRRPWHAPPPILPDSCSDDTPCLRGMDITLESDAFLLVANLNGSAGFSQDAISGLVHERTTTRSFGLGLGTDCAANDTDQISFGAFDLAGNFSGWGVESTLGKPVRCGCAQYGRHTSASALVMLIILGSRVRRPRRKG